MYKNTKKENNERVIPVLTNELKELFSKIETSENFNSEAVYNNFKNIRRVT